MPWNDQWLSYALRVAAVLFLCLSFGLGVAANASGMAIAAVISAMLAVVSLPKYFAELLDRLQSAEVAGLKVVLKDKITKADELIGRLNKLTGVIASPLYSVLALQGRTIQLTGGRRADMIRELDRALNEAGFNNAQINNFKAEVHHMNMLSVAARIDKKLRPKTLQAAEAIMARLEDFPQPIPPEYSEAARQISADAQNCTTLQTITGIRYRPQIIPMCRMR